MSELSSFDALQARGMIEAATDSAAVKALFDQPPASIYAGFDPTAASLHVGHLLPVLVLRRLQLAGHRPILLVGGATGIIGDPSGRSAERNLLTFEHVASNVERLRCQLARFFQMDGPAGAVVLNNVSWIGTFSCVDWLRNVGKHFTVSSMLAKESVRRRLEEREQGISYTEFSYMLLQAYDFLHLYDTHQCRLQLGGADQWGNITAGIDLIRKVRGVEAFGLTLPLVTTAAGEKFGKSAGNAVWLDGDLTSPYDFYKFWLQTSDCDVDRYLRLFTFLPTEEIEVLCNEHAKLPTAQSAQRRLAEEVTRLVHGPKVASGMALAALNTAALV